MTGRLTIIELLLFLLARIEQPADQVMNAWAAAHPLKGGRQA